MSDMKHLLNPQRTLSELKELRELTSDENGAQRVAFTPIWEKARAWLKEKLAELPVEVHTDAAGNLWATLRGASEKALLMGGHLDSVPNGGWLDGSLNVLGALEVMRRLNAQYSGKPPVTVRLVDWADEEGARFGKSLYGSSACSGTLNMTEAATLTDRNGITLPDALKEYGIVFENVKDSGQELQGAAAYLALHIEQGPVLLDLDAPLGAVLGTFGVERHAVTFRGEPAHSGATPMNRRKDAFLAAAQMSPLIYKLAKKIGGVCTIGSCTTKPGIVTSVVEECRITLDQRHLEAGKLERLFWEARDASEKFAEEGHVEVTWDRLWAIEPVLFNPELVALCEAAIRETCGGKVHKLPSGPLHDAAEISAAGVPSVMLFVQSLNGISHNKNEDTKEEHLVLAVKAFDKLADKTVAWILEG
jgi:beta-ureidopropionase / N-carbamoyl-L-amino-acid hydrolase